MQGFAFKTATVTSGAGGIGFTLGERAINAFGKARAAKQQLLTNP
ncbi:MAG: hypothetical protein OXF68_07940 [Gammaproteobacteria bacterium]|nr:hypothetical protein [Gammaproteobacteria bacterium]MCY4345079.1 hypothetical protein [Gammaproteobacteria bacterium]